MIILEKKIQKKLTINPDEAVLMREIFKLYIEGNSLIKVAQILNSRGLRSRQWPMKNGKTYGGKKYGVTQIQSLIQNVLYVGKVKYAGQIYDSQQEAILDEETFKKAQDQLKAKAIERNATKNTDCIGLLNHILHCPTCNTVMFHTYTMKPNKHKYRYYVCTNIQKRGYNECPTKSLNAQAVENLVIAHLILLFTNRTITKNYPNTTEMEAIISPIWDDLLPDEKRRILRKLVERIECAGDINRLSFILKEIDKPFEFTVDLKSCQPQNRWHKEVEIKNEPVIRKNLILAHQLQKMLDQGQVKDLNQASEWLNISQSRLNHIFSFLLLSPSIQMEIISDNTIIESIPEYKVRSLATEVDWEKQNDLWQEIKRATSPD